MGVSQHPVFNLCNQLTIIYYCIKVMDRLPAQYDNNSTDEQLKAFASCSLAISKKPEAFMVYEV